MALSSGAGVVGRTWKRAPPRLSLAVRARILVVHLLHALPAAALFPRRAGDRAAAGGEAARTDSRRVLLDPDVVEHHHGAVELFSSARSRLAGFVAGRLAQTVHGQTDRDARALELDGRADGGPDVHGVRRGLFGRSILSAHRPRHVSSL